MVKNLYAVMALLCFAWFLSPLNFIKGEVTITTLGKSAGDFITACKTDVASFVNIDGVCFDTEKEELESLIDSLGGKKVHSFFDGEILNLYYYSNKIPVKEVIKNKKVNIHVAINSEKIKVGIPFIYYGY